MNKNNIVAGKGLQFSAMDGERFNSPGKNKVDINKVNPSNAAFIENRVLGCFAERRCAAGLR